MSSSSGASPPSIPFAGRGLECSVGAALRAWCIGRSTCDGATTVRLSLAKPARLFFLVRSRDGPGERRSRMPTAPASAYLSYCALYLHGTYSFCLRSSTLAGPFPARVLSGPTGGPLPRSERTRPAPRHSHFPCPRVSSNTPCSATVPRGNSPCVPPAAERRHA